jgi:hypothetical protein
MNTELNEPKQLNHGPSTLNYKPSLTWLFIVIAVLFVAVVGYAVSLGR